MFVLLISIVSLHQVFACNVGDLCPEDNRAVQSEIVDLHNSMRRSVEPSASDMLMMSYSEDVAVSAQAWADQCILGHGPPSARMIDGYEMGENLYYSSRADSWTDVINAWHGEVENYRYPTGSTNGKAVGHYTQVVWNTSYKIGCGVKKCPGNIYFYACHYFRAGNFLGRPPYKAGAPCASCPDACTDGLCTNPCPFVNRYTNCPELKDEYGCSHPSVRSWCPASCRCTTEIIPAGK